jgi:hypothetical protein
MLLVGESFENPGMPPDGWSSYIGGGNTYYNWERVSVGNYPTTYPHSGSWLAELNCMYFWQGWADLVTPNYNFTWRTSGSRSRSHSGSIGTWIILGHMTEWKCILIQHQT